MRKIRYRGRSICLLLSILLTLSVFTGTFRQDLRADTSDCYEYVLPHYHPEAVYPGGWVRHAGNSIYFFEVSSHRGKIAYCMEPGRSRRDGTVANSQTPEEVFSSGNDVLTGEQIRNFTELIMNYGYRGSAAHLTTSNGTTDPDDNLYYAVATQILIWEVLIGERDASFNRRDTGGPELSTFILGAGVDGEDEAELAFHRAEDYWYRRIVDDVRSCCSDDRIPSFAYRTEREASNNSGELTYHVDPQRRYTELTDSNGVLGRFSTVLFTVNGQNVNVDYNVDTVNNRLILAFNDRSVDIDDVLVTLRSSSPTRSYILVYGDGRWGPDWAESDNWQEIATWGEQGYDEAYVRLSDDTGFSVSKVADSSGDNIEGIAFNLWRYADGRTSGFCSPSLGDTIVAGGFTDSRGRLIWESNSSDVLDLPAGYYGINEIYVPTYFDTLDNGRIEYPYSVPTERSRTWIRAGSSSSHTFYTSFYLGDGSDTEFVLHNHRSQGGFALNKMINPLTGSFTLSDVDFDLYYDSDMSGSYTASDLHVAEGTSDANGRVLWNGNGYSGRYRFTDLPCGQYVIREQWEDPGFEVVNGSSGWNRRGSCCYERTITVRDGGNDTYTVVNRPQLGRLSVHKVLRGPQDLFNASMITFTLYRGSSRIARGRVDPSTGNVLWTGSASGISFADSETVDSLAYGDYTIEETWSATGFDVVNLTQGWTRRASNRYTYGFTVSGNSRELSFDVINEVRYGGISVHKLTPPGDTFDVSSVSFELYRDNGADGIFVARGNTRPDGNVVWDRDVSSGLRYGDYILREIFVTEGVSPAGTRIDYDTLNTGSNWTRTESPEGTICYENRFTISAPAVMSFDVMNDEQTNSLRVLKVPLTDGDECDVSFELVTSEGSVYASGSVHTSPAAGTGSPVLWNVDGTGAEILTRIPAGTYELRESIPQTSYVGPDGNTVSEAVFTYAVPEGFELSEDGTYFRRNIEITDGENEVIDSIAENRRIEGEIRIDKISENGIAWGIPFEVVYRGNSPRFDDETAPYVELGTFVTGEDGSLIIDALPLGWYEIREISPENTVCHFVGPTVGNGVKRVHLTESNGTASVSVTAMNIISAVIRVTKTDLWSGEAVGGASFNLYRDSDGDGVIDDGGSYSRMTDSDGDGIVTWEGLPAGDYLISEARTVDGYCLNETVFPVTVSEAAVYDVNIPNTPVTLNILIYKTDAADSSRFLDGAVFELYEDTNGNDEYDEEDLRATTYADGEYAEVNIIRSVDDMGEPVYTLDHPVRPGVYFIIEVQAPEGYSIDGTDNCYRIDLTEPGGTETMERSFFITNGLEGSIRILKVDEEHPERRLSGAVFSVWRDSDGDGRFSEEEDEYLGTMDEYDTGEYLMHSLPFGTYFVEETVSPEGYIRREEIFTAYITCDGMVYDIKDPGFTGLYNIAEGDVFVYKTDAEYPGTMLSGAEFTVYEQASGRAVGALEEHEGMYSLVLPSGDYYLMETRAPSGFVRDTGIYPFSISSDNRHAVIDNAENVSRPVPGCFIDEPVRASIRITKSVEDGQSLEGFTFDLIRGDEVIASTVTDSEGHALFTDLRCGTYIIRETASSATDGRYHIAPDTVVVIEDDEEINGTVLNVTIVNKPLTPTPASPGVPSTGEAADAVTPVFGALSIAASFAVLRHLRRREEG